VRPGRTTRSRAASRGETGRNAMRSGGSSKSNSAVRMLLHTSACRSGHRPRQSRGMEPKRGLWTATYRSGSEAEAVASYRCARLPIGAKNPNAFTFGWFRRQQNFDGDCPLRQNGVFGELDESHALVAVASNDFHRLGVSDGHNNTRAGEANGCRHGEMS